jgi:hypothetical protein
VRRATADEDLGAHHAEIARLIEDAVRRLSSIFVISKPGPEAATAYYSGSEYPQGKG